MIKRETEFFMDLKKTFVFQGGLALPDDFVQNECTKVLDANTSFTMFWWRDVLCTRWNQNDRLQHVWVWGKLSISLQSVTAVCLKPLFTSISAEFDALGDIVSDISGCSMYSNEENMAIRLLRRSK